MKKHEYANTSSATIDDYRNGKHRRWEVELHRFDRRYTAVGMDVDFAARSAFIDTWLANHTFDDAQQIVSCEICQEEIAKALLNKTDPFAIPMFVKDICDGLARRQALKSQGERTWIQRVVAKG